jgi:hypothetical protein
MSLFGLVCVVVVVFATGITHAQQRRGFSGRTASTLSVAAVPEVAKELELTDKQTELAKELATEQNNQRQELFQNFGDLSQQERQERIQTYSEQREEKEKQLAESVGQEKFQRIQQLSLQAGGEISAFFDQQTAQKLGITDDQRNQARESLSGLGEEFRAAGDDAEARAKLLTKVNEKVAAVLTDEQKSKWKELQGKPAGKELLAKIRAAISRRRSA